MGPMFFFLGLALKILMGPMCFFLVESPNGIRWEAMGASQGREGWLGWSLAGNEQWKKEIVDKS